MADTPIDPVYFYVLVRTDFDSMVQGRSDAQVSHATSELHELMTDRRIFAALNLNASGWAYTTALKLFEEWRFQAGRFGTAIILGGKDMADIYGAVEFAKKAGFDAGITHDPEYWRRDGKKSFALPEDTCGWMFGRKGELKILLKQFPLLKPLDPNEDR